MDEDEDSADPVKVLNNLDKILTKQLQETSSDFRSGSAAQIKSFINNDGELPQTDASFGNMWIPGAAPFIIKPPQAVAVEERDTVMWRKSSHVRATDALVVKSSFDSD